MSWAVTWWGHASTSVELPASEGAESADGADGPDDRVVVATDPLLTRRLFHLHRTSPAPPPAATTADVVVVSHLHHDHLHLPSLDRFGTDVPVVVPRGAAREVPGLARRHLVEVAPGDEVEVAGVRVQVLPATHDGRRDPLPRRGTGVPAVGFRLASGGTTVWYPGDTGVREDFADVEPVDLALVPIGGWGPSLGHEHLDPEQAAAAVQRVGARWALPVHYGTFWPVGLRRLQPSTHHHFFSTPPGRFVAAVAALDAAAGPVPTALVPGFAERTWPTST